MTGKQLKGPGVLDAHGVNDLHNQLRQENNILIDKVMNAIPALEASRKEFESAKANYESSWLIKLRPIIPYITIIIVSISIVILCLYVPSFKVNLKDWTIEKIENCSSKK